MNFEENDNQEKAQRGVTDVFSAALNDLLSSELVPYGIRYSWAYSDDYECVVATLTPNFAEDRAFDVHFRHEAGGLMIEMDEDCWQVVRGYDTSVKYFWICVAPQVWGN